MYTKSQKQLLIVLQQSTQSFASLQKYLLIFNHKNYYKVAFEGKPVSDFVTGLTVVVNRLVV